VTPTEVVFGGRFRLIVLVLPMEKQNMFGLRIFLISYITDLMTMQMNNIANSYDGYTAEQNIVYAQVYCKVRAYRPSLVLTGLLAGATGWSVVTSRSLCRTS